MEGRGEEVSMEVEDAPHGEAIPQQQEHEHERMLQMGHYAGDGGEREGVDAPGVPSLDVEDEQPQAQPREVSGEEEERGSAGAGVAEEEEGGSAGAGEEEEWGLAGAEEGAVSHGMEVEGEGVAVDEMDDERPPGMGTLPPTTPDAADGEEAEEVTEEEHPPHEEQQEEEPAEERGVLLGMEAEDEEITADDVETAELPELVPLSSDFAAAEEKEEANSPGSYPAVDDDVIADDDAADEDEEEEAACAMVLEEKELEASVSGARGRGGGRKKRGRPPRAQASRLPTKKKEEEDLCFICFDGGNLVVCDRRGCPKVYHPACVNRDESFFRSKGRWNCGWHICSICEKAAHFMCLTCTYSLCKTCIKGSEFVCVRGNKGFCETCRSTVMLIETDEQEKTKVAGVDFDDRNSWMYLFKDYWLDMKRKLSLTLEEISKAKNPWKGPLDQNGESSDELYDAKEDLGSSSDSSSVRREGSKPVRKKAKRQSKTTVDVEEPVKLLNNEVTSLPEDSEWASEGLLEFVAHMRDGDKSVMCQFDVHTLLLEYIKRNNLRDPRRKSQIICDSRLEKLFGKARVGHFEMLKLLESHFLLKETSQAVTDDNQGGVVDPEFSQMDTEGNSEVVPRTSSEKKRRSRKRIEEREPQNNLDDYAAIDIHNISLIYLRRNLMEELLDDTENFNEKVVGSFVRIRISGAGQRQDMYRLVQVVGTGKVAEKYKTGKRTTDITLEILNLSKMEVISIDSISNQEFTEEECDRLRQSIKCGLINRLTVRDVLEKAMALQAVRVNESLENEKLRLSHLRDRASEKGRRKELRECVEKLQLLNSPEERSRRLNDVPEVHTDPKMDPNYESAEEESDNLIRSTDSRFVRMGRELNSSLKGNPSSTDSWSGSRRGSTASWESSKTLSTRGTWDKVETSIGDRVHELTSNHKDLYQANSWDMSKSPATAAVKDTGAWNNGQAGIRLGQPETSSASQCTETVIQSNVNENEKMWHYQDPSAKIQGPFSMTQLRKWSTTGYFPANLKIWRTSEKQEDSILLTDALVGKFQQELPLLEIQRSTLTHLPKVTEIVDAREGNCKGNWRANNDSWVEKKEVEGGLSRNESNLSGSTNLGLTKADGWTSQSSGWSSPNTGPVIPRDGKVGGSSRVWETSKDPNAWSSQLQAHDMPSLSTAQFPANPNQLSPRQGRGRGGNAGRWKGGLSQSHGNTWGSNRPASVHPAPHGYERQQSNYVYPGHQSPAEPWKIQSATNSNHWGNDSFNLPTPTPRPGGGWMGSQGIGNQSSASPTVSVQPAATGWAGIATQGGNSAQFPSVAVNEASKGGLAWVEQLPSSGCTLPSWGPNPSPKPTETAAGWDSSATATVAIIKERVLSDGLGTAREPNVQNVPSVLDGQTSLANDSSSKAPFENEMLKPASGKDDGNSRVTSCIFQKNRHMKDDCPSPTPKDEQAKFDVLISESSQQNGGATAVLPASNVCAENREDNQSSHLVSNTSNAPSGNEISSTKPAAGADDLGSQSSEKLSADLSDSKYISEPHEKASDLSLRQEIVVLNPVPKEDGLEQSQHQTPSFHVLEPAKSGHLGFPAGRSEWSMPSPTPVVEPSVSHGAAESSFVVNPASSAQWNSNIPLGPMSLPNVAQGTGYNEIQHLGVGSSQENMNRGVEPGKESGYINFGTVVQGTTNAGLGTVVPANTTGVWTNAPQGNANVNLGWCHPPQGNANMNMFWLALAQANPGWANPVQGNPNPSPGWVLTAPANTPTASSWGAVTPQCNPMTTQNWVAPVQANANPVAGWATPQSNANPNAGWFGQGNVNVASSASVGNPASWGTQQKHNADGYPGHDDRGFQNNEGGHGGARHGWNRSQNSGGGGSSRAPPRVQRGGICKYHESGHCRKGANCKFLHT